MKTNSEIIAESGWRETDLRRTYNKKQIIEMLDKARASGVEEEKRTVPLCVRLNPSAEGFNAGFIKGRNSALAEISKLNQQLISQEADFNNEVILLKKQLSEKNKEGVKYV